MEEVWLHRHKENLKTSVHLEDFPITPDEWINSDIEKKWSRIRDIRGYVNLAIEKERQNKNIRSSLEASPNLYIKDKNLFKILDSINFNEVCITSSLRLNLLKDSESNSYTVFEDGIEVNVKKAEGEKCNRCWKYTNSYTNFKNNIICHRCDEVLKKL